MYVLHGNRSYCEFYSFSSVFYFIGDKISANCFKDEITSSLKTNDGLKFSQDVVFNHVREKGNPQCKILYTVFKELYGYYTLIDIYTYPTLIQLDDYIDGVHHCIKVVGKWIFDSNFPFAPSLTKDNLDY